MQITVSEFARRQGVSRQRVYKWMEADGVRGQKLANLTLLSASDCRKLLAARKPSGRPKKSIDRPSRVA